MLAGHASDPARHDTLHGRDRGVRGAAVLDARTRRRLADCSRAGAVLGEGARQAAVPRRDHRREPADRGARGFSQAPGAGRELPDADALELPPADARPEHELLRGRVCRPHRRQGDADRACRARHLDDRRRDGGVHRHLLRNHRRRAGRLRPVDAAAVSRLARALSRYAGLVRAAARPRRHAAGGCALADDGPDRRCVHQYRDRQALLSCEARSRIRARCNARIHAHRIRAVPAGHRLRDRQPHAQHDPHRRQRGRRAVALDAGAGRRRRRRGDHGDGAASERYLALDHVGVRLAVRAHRHRAGRNRHACAAARGAGSSGRAAAQGAARRDPLRARDLRLRRQARR